MLTPLEPQPKLAKFLGIETLYFKREDLHPYRSHKGRSIPLMIDLAVENGTRKFVISSSGNAALAAILHIKKHLDENPALELSLEVYVGKNISIDKLSILQDEVLTSSGRIQLIQTDRPLQATILAAKDPQIKILRQSTDDIALMGYQTLAEEIQKNTGTFSAIFIPASSGTTAQALGEHFNRLEISPEIHVAQTAQTHPIASLFGKQPEQKEKSLAQAIVDSVAYRKEAVAEIVKKSGGAVWIISNTEILNAQKEVREKTGVTLSPNGVLSIAALMKARSQGWTATGPVICLITGQ